MSEFDDIATGFLESREAAERTLDDLVKMVRDVEAGNREGIKSVVAAIVAGLTP